MRRGECAPVRPKPTVRRRARRLAPWGVEPHRPPTLSEAGTPVWGQKGRIRSSTEGRENLPPRGRCTSLGRSAQMATNGIGWVRGWYKYIQSDMQHARSRHMRSGAYRPLSTFASVGRREPTQWHVEDTLISAAIDFEVHMAWPRAAVCR